MSAALFAAIALLTPSAVTPPANQHPGEPPATIEQAVVRAVSNAMPEAAYDWSLDWNAFGARVGRGVFWHLNAPESYRPHPLPAGIHRRTGWVSVNGRTGDVAVCGDADRVGRLSLTVSDTWLGESDVIAELAERGVRATLTEVMPAVPPPESGPYYRTLIAREPARRTWRLEQDGREPVDLTAEWSCTPPGTRSATRCRMTWSVLFRPDERAAGTQPCLPPARPGETVRLD